MTKRYSVSPYLVPSLVIALMVLQGCGNDHSPTAPAGSSMVTLSFQRLEPLEGGLSYQAWAVEERDDGSFRGHPFATFNMNQAGQVVTPVSGAVITGGFEAPLDAEDLFGVGLTIETSVVGVTIPSDTFILGGPVVGGVVQMTTDHWLGIGQDLSVIQGRYVLATPTDQDPENELGGIWFLDPFQGPDAPGLQLPTLLNGWDYEGWVVIEGQPVSTGKFFQADATDGSFLYSGSVQGPAVPGEDFLRNAPTGLTFPPDLSGAEVFITMEPWQQWDQAPNEPFFVRILEADIPPARDPGHRLQYDLSLWTTSTRDGNGSVMGKGGGGRPPFHRF